MAVALKVSRAVAELLRAKREELGLSLREVEKRTAEAGELIPFPTLARVEQGRVDPGVRRLHLLLRLYQVPAGFVSDLIELEAFAGKLPKTQDPKKLWDDGVEFWKQGETRKGVACLLALQKLLKDRPTETAFRHKAIAFFAVMAGALGKHQMALDLLAKLFVERPTGRGSGVRARSGGVLLAAARCQRGRHGVPRARREAHGERTDPRTVRGSSISRPAA